MAWTIEYNGTEAYFSDWGVALDGITLSTASMSIDVFSLQIPGATINDAPVFPFEGKIIVRRDRTDTGGRHFTGGSIVFQGKRLAAIRDGHPGYAGVTYEFAGPWYDIQETPYQQSIYNYTGDPQNLEEVFVSDVTLFQRVTGAGTWEKRNTGQQVTDILQHVINMSVAIGNGAPFSIGVIEPATNVNTYPARDLKCGEAIFHCLRSSPDVVCYFDYATNPPTFHAKKRSSLPAVAVALGDQVSHESVRIRPRPDLQPRSVFLIFKQSNDEGGFTWVQTTPQEYPVLLVRGGLRSIVQTIDLEGYAKSNVYGELLCRTVANTRDWWKRYVPEVGSLRIRGWAVTAMQVVDEDTGAAVNLATYPTVLEDGAIADWMKLVGGNPVDSKRVVIRAFASYDQYNEDASGDPETSVNGIKLEKVLRKELVARVTVTNAPAGRSTYTAMSSFVAAEEIPAGMAQSIYTALQELQYDGQVRIADGDCLVAVGLGNVLNITGGANEWASARMLIQSVERDLSTGKTMITVGPAKHLGAGDLTQLFLMNRNRRMWQDPSTNATAQRSSGASVKLGKTNVRENTQAAWPERSLGVKVHTDGTSGNRSVISEDAAGQTLKLQVLDAAGAPVPAAGSVDISLGTIVSLAPVDKRAAQFREFSICVGSPPVMMKVLLLATEPYTT